MLLKFPTMTAADRRQQTSWHIDRLMRLIAGNEPVLFEVVAGGPVLFRQRFLSAYRTLAVDESVADHVFAFFCLQIQRKYPGATAGQLLDGLEIPSPPSQAEIDDAWTVESASSEAGRRHFYGDKHPEEVVKEALPAVFTEDMKES